MEYEEKRNQNKMIMQMLHNKTNNKCILAVMKVIAEKKLKTDSYEPRHPISCLMFWHWNWECV